MLTSYFRITCPFILNGRRIETRFLPTVKDLHTRSPHAINTKMINNNDDNKRNFHVTNN